VRRIFPYIFVISTAFCSSAFADIVIGRVIGISDGDTLTLHTHDKQQLKVRLAGIDAPEKGQSFGQASKRNLSELVYGKRVEVESNKKDRYGRTVGKVLSDGFDVNLEQVKAGLAWHYKAYEKEQTPSDRIAYAEAEQSARAARKGLWIDQYPIPPWEFRASTK